MVVLYIVSELLNIREKKVGKNESMMNDVVKKAAYYSFKISKIHEVARLLDVFTLAILPISIARCEMRNIIISLLGGGKPTLRVCSRQPFFIRM